MDTTMMPQSMGQAPFYFYNSESKQQQQQMGAMYKPAHGMPGTPAYSRPGSSCSQPPTLYSNAPSVMTPTGSPPPMSHRPAIMLDTDLSCDSYFPATPPLSTAGSSMGSPQTGDALQTPMNPMFSGLDGLEGVKDGLESAETSVLDWSNCASPSMTPMYLQSQTSGQAPSVNTSDLLSTTSCPSLSPSPAPYARSIAASEQDVDFCDPRNLTVTSAPAATSNPTLVPECSTASPASEQLATKTQEAGAVAPQPTFDFDPAIPDGLPSFEELGNLESEDDFVNSLVNLGDSAPDVGRPRAGTGSSVVSLGHGSFIGEDDLDFDDNEVFQLPSLPTPISTDDDSHKDKRQKKTHKKDERTLAPAMTQAAGAAKEVDTQQSPQKSDDDAASDSNASSGSESGNAQVTAPTSRRGRKQSLTEDPSKTFVCDLCSRRFRRQEHLKRHYRSLHTQEKPFECNECGKKFSRSDNLAQHARTHAGGAIVMNLIDENGAPTYDPSMAPAPSGEDYGTYGKVLFQIASEVPGSASEPSSEEEKDDGKNKRKRSD